MLLTLAAALGLWLFISGNYRRAEEEEIRQRLATINSYKTAQISDWLVSHNREARRLSRHSFLGEIVSGETSRPGSRRAALVPWLIDHAQQKGYTSMAFLSPKGAVIAATPGYAPGTEKQFTEAFKSASQKGAALVTDLYAGADGKPRLTMFSPVTAGGRGGAPLCVLVMNIDPELRLYPLLKEAPQYYAQSETLLVRREGDDVVYLSKPRHAEAAALGLRLPVTHERLPAAAAVMGRAGFFEGVNYRGEDVFFAIDRVEGSDWAVVTQTGRDIVLAPVISKELMALALIALAAALFYAMFYLVLRTRELAARKLAEEALRAGRERLSLALDVGNAGIWEWDRRSGKVFLDDRFHALLGYAPGELPDTQAEWLTYHHPEDVPVWTARAEKYLRGEAPVYESEHRIRGKTGAWEWVLTRGKLVKPSAAGSPELFVGIAMNITARRKAEEKQRETEERYSGLFRRMRDSFVRVSMDGPILEFNEAYAGLTGYTPQELRKLSYKDLTPARWHSLEQRIVEEQVLPRGYSEVYEREYLRKDGTLVPIELVTTLEKDASGKPSAMCAMIRDITARKRAEEALRKSEADNITTLQNLQVGVVVHAEDTGIISNNMEAERVLGLTADQMAGKKAIDPAWRFVSEDLRRLELKDYPVNRAISSLAPFSGQVLGIQRPDRDYITWVSVGATPILAAGGGLERVVVNFVDITARKQAEIEMERLNRELVESKQEMENFLYITTHDLRSPLVNILGFSRNLEGYAKELLEALAPADLPPETKKELEAIAAGRIPEALKFVTESSLRMDALISALLKVSRLGRVEMKPAVVDMNAALKKAADAIRYQLDAAGGTVTVQPLPPCKADPGAVDQIFANLLDNAVKFRRADRPPLIKVAGETAGSRVIYTVTDNGAGIPAANLPRIWDVFYRTAGAHGEKGEGIGLPMARRLAERNGGSIRAVPQEGEGSVFSVELPRGEEEKL